MSCDPISQHGRQASHVSKLSSLPLDVQVDQLPQHEDLLLSTHPLVDLNTNGPLGHVPDQAGLSVVPLVRHTLRREEDRCA